MHIRTRKLIGTFALLALVTVWALLAMAFAQFALRAQSEWVALLFYAVAGLGWAGMGLLGNATVTEVQHG